MLRTASGIRDALTSDTGMMVTSAWIARKLQLRRSPSDGSSTTGIVIAIAAVGLALMIMELTLGIVAGFKRDITDRVMGFDGQVSVCPAYEYETGETQPYISTDSTLMQSIVTALPAGQPSVKLNIPGILKTSTDFAGIYFIGHDESYTFDFERNAIVSGSLPDMRSRESEIALSRATATALSLKTGDKVDACFFINDAIRSRRFTISGIYDTGFSEYDRNVAFIPIATLRRIAAVDSCTGTQIDISGLDAAVIPTAAETLQQLLLARYQSGEISELYPVNNVITGSGAAYFGWLRLLDTNVVVIFILMLCVAGFTLVASMIIIVIERIPAIGLLRAIGASRRMIRQIFVNLSMRILLPGMLVGNVLGLGLLLIQQRYNLVGLDPDTYYLNSVPVYIHWWWMLALNIGVLLVCRLVMLLPASVAASISPASVIRYE